uniref:Mobile element protein n=1 Tax=Raoultella ornithinolytica TaxID=54291 RepID=A0A6B7Q3Y8_RAOOR|nr:Mobile element protein [Raoultella ornithinolytica]
MIAFNHVVPVLNLSVFNVRRAPAFAFEQSKRATIGGRFIRVDESRDLPLLHVVEDFTQKPVCSFAVTTGGEIKIDSAAPAVDGPVQIRPAAIDLHVGFIHVPRAKIGRVTPVPAQPFFHFRRITLNPAVNRGVIDIHSAFSQHLLQLTVTDAVFAVPAYGPQNDVTLKMPAFEWVHVQLHQQKGMISLSPPTICNSAKLTSVNLIRGTISPPWRIRTIPRTFPGCSTRTTRPIPGANCVCVRSISSSRRRCRTFSPAITSCIKPMTTWRIKLLSTSTTPIRCCRSRS